jgi:6-phosphofructokinase 1
MATKKITAKKNALYAQAGGMTSVINISACGVLETAMKHKDKIGKVFIGNHGIQGVLLEELFDMSKESKKSIENLRYMPGGAFGTCRYKLTPFTEDPLEYKRVVDVFKAHDIGYFFYNGGNDSADTAHKISQFCKKMDYPVVCIGIPKTVDNDLSGMDFSPGFPSAAKYVATTMKEVDTYAAAISPATQIFILEVPGRHAGWLASAGVLAKEKESDGPHIIMCPEILFDEEKFLSKVDHFVKKYGYCSIVTSESLRNKDGVALASTGQADGFGHVQLNGIAFTLARKIQEKFGYKYHLTIADYLCAISRHLSSALDVKMAYECGKKAVEFALKGKTGIAPAVIRGKGKQPTFKIIELALSKIANTERNLPRDFIADDGFMVTQKCVDYLKPLIQGEAPVPFKNGVPQYPTFKKELVKKKLPTFIVTKSQ